MFRSALALAIVFCLSSSTAFAQGPRFNVTDTSVSVYQAPSAGSPVIGQSSAGAVLEVRGEFAGWVQIVWPKAADGVAYIQAGSGWIETPAPNRAASAAQRPLTIEEFVHGTTAAQIPGPAQASDLSNSTRTAPQVQRPMTIDEFVHGASATSLSASAPAAGPSNPSAAYVAEAVAAVSSASTRRANVTAASATYQAPAHFVGLGARIGELTRNVGATGRMWTRERVGVQFEILRNATTNAALAERVTSLQFAPSVLYALPNAVSDYFWLRPYVGGGATIYRSTLRSTNTAETGSSTDGAFGIQLFGGGELTFAGVPRFALSADVGYRSAQAGFAGFERRKIGFALSGHWFVR